MSIHADKSRLQEILNKGFAVIPGALEEGEVESLRRELSCLVAEDLEHWKDQPNHPANKIDRWMVHNPMARAPTFARILENQLMHAYLTELLTESCILYAYTTSSMPPGGTNYSNRIHVDCPRFIKDYITNVGVILPLDDFTEKNGATYFMPGSHLKAAPPTEQEFFAAAERIAPKAGDMVVFNARTFHLGGTNEMAVARHAITLNACRSYMRQRFDYPRLMPNKIVADLGALGRRFLGFDVRVPCSIEEYYLPADQRLYKANHG